MIEADNLKIRFNCPVLHALPADCNTRKNLTNLYNLQHDIFWPMGRWCRTCL